MYIIGILLYMKIYIFTNSAFLNWKRAASQNFPAARLRMGDHYWYGKGVQQDLRQAANYYRIVSEDNDAHSAAQVFSDSYVFFVICF